tara:strand:+ start:68 stop:475 length:408 start_codon:yes stop_codon:yes gene_type:complete
MNCAFAFGFTTETRRTQRPVFSILFFSVFSVARGEKCSLSPLAVSLRLATGKEMTHPFLNEILQTRRQFPDHCNPNLLALAIRDRLAQLDCHHVSLQNPTKQALSLPTVDQVMQQLGYAQERSHGKKFYTEALAN